MSKVRVKPFMASDITGLSEEINWWLECGNYKIISTEFQACSHTGAMLYALVYYEEVGNAR